MTETVGDTIKEFPVELNAQNTIQPWIQDQFDVDPAKASLTNDAAAILHTFVAKAFSSQKERDPIFFLLFHS